MRPIKDEGMRFAEIVAPIAHEFSVFDAACAEVQCSKLAVTLSLSIILGRNVTPTLRSRVAERLAHHFALEVEVVDGLLEPLRDQASQSGQIDA